MITREIEGHRLDDGYAGIDANEKTRGDRWHDGCSLLIRILGAFLAIQSNF